MAKFFHRAFVLIAMTLAAMAVAAAETPKIKLGFAKCAHCLPMSLTPGLAKGVEIEATGFNSGNDVLTALVSKSIDVAQVTYLHYVTALDKGFDVVAVSGQINGGSECISSNKLVLPGEDWAGFKALVAKAKAGGQPLKVAASRGNAQDIHMRGAFTKQGIDMRKDVEFINIPNPSDHAEVTDTERHEKHTEGEHALELALPLIDVAAGGKAEGSVSVRHDPMDAIEEALREGDFHEIILSATPHSISRWLHVDLPHRVEHLGLPLTAIIAETRAAT